MLKVLINTVNTLLSNSNPWKEMSRKDRSQSTTILLDTIETTLFTTNKKEQDTTSIWHDPIKSEEVQINTKFIGIMSYLRVEGGGGGARRERC